MSESGRSVIVDVQDVKMVYNSKSRDESTHVHALRGLSVQVYETNFSLSWDRQAQVKARCSI